MSESRKTHIIVGAGAAGFFGAIACASKNPNDRVIIIEKTRQPLAKVRISGGGRCNVTHACFDPKLLVKNYPRGSAELLGPFYTFQPQDTVEWFESRSVVLKAEDDGRMFPITDSSETIINCLYAEAKRCNVEIKLESGLVAISKQADRFVLELTSGESLVCDSIMMTTGSASKVYTLLQELGHTIVPLVPSLFTFNIPSSPLVDLSGVSVSKAHVKIEESPFEQTGPLLITHWGFSGPAVLKLSAWGARWLHEASYKATVIINWLPDNSPDELRSMLVKARDSRPQKQIGTESPVNLPRQLWNRLVHLAPINVEKKWVDLSNKEIASLIAQLNGSKFSIDGKTTYKQEFVTCGGVKLKEVNFKTMESKKCPGIYFAGEILDIDGVTGGFNFQNAWTTGWIAGHAMGA